MTTESNETKLRIMKKGYGLQELNRAKLKGKYNFFLQAILVMILSVFQCPIWYFYRSVHFASSIELSIIRSIFLSPILYNYLLRVANSQISQIVCNFFFFDIYSVFMRKFFVTDFDYFLINYSVIISFPTTLFFEEKLYYDTLLNVRIIFVLTIASCLFSCTKTRSLLITNVLLFFIFSNIQYGAEFANRTYL